MNEQLERFVNDLKHEINGCLRGRFNPDDFDMPSKMDAEQLKEQFEEFYLKRPCEDDIDWKALGKELETEALEVIAEWRKRKNEWEREEAVRAGRI